MPGDSDAYGSDGKTRPSPLNVTAETIDLTGDRVTGRSTTDVLESARTEPGQVFQTSTAVVATPRQPPVRFGVFEADFEAGELRKHGMRLKLPQQAFRVLQVLIERPNEVISREELRQSLWPADTFVEFDHCLLYTSPSPRDS